MKTAMLIVTVLCFGCSDGISLARPDAGSVPDAGEPAVDVGTLDSSASDTVVATPDAGPADSVPADALDCNRVPIANVYGCETADRITVPFVGVDRDRITIYLESSPIPASLWRLADDGVTLVLQHCAGTMMLSFSLDCRSTVDDCHLTAKGC